MKKTKVSDNALNEIKLIKLKRILEEFRGDDSTDGVFTINGEKIRATHIECTPELAQYILDEFNDSNRPAKKVNLNYLKREILNGNWLTNGDTIKFNNDGSMNDGQHRLKSIIETNVTLPLIVISGLTTKSFKSLDVGTKRTGSDVLAVKGVKNSTNSASVVKFIHAFSNNKYSENTMATRTLSNTNIEDYYDLLMPNIETSVKFINNYSSTCKGFIRPTLIGGFHYLLGEIDPELRDEFLIKLCTGIGLEADSPITALRSKLIRIQYDKNSRLTNLDMLKNIVYTWNKCRKGQTAKNIKIPSDFKIKLL